MKKITFFKLFLQIFGMLFISLSLFSQYPGVGEFTRVTKMEGLTDGFYVIVNSNEAFAMNNISGKYFDKTDVFPLSGKIIDPSPKIVWRINTNGGGRSIYSEEASSYVSYTGNNNEAHAVNTVVSNNQRWVFTLSAGVFKVNNLAVSERYLQYNPVSPRFACYKATQQHLLLYKLDEITWPYLYAPVATTASNIGQTNFTANWNVVDGATLYLLNVYTKEEDEEYIDSEEEITITPISESPFIVSNANYKVIDGLSQCANYYYTLTAMNPQLSSEESNEIEVWTKDLDTSLLPVSTNKIITNDGCIYFSGIAGDLVKIYNNLGQVLYSGTAVDGCNILRINTNGIILIKVGSRNAKVKL